ncbi:MAG: hypothetical protein HY013_16625, partial [Candidatus Solibacter usitatus]|nr:hypothetical protein [Candidatus Solibacter usitatus]
MRALVGRFDWDGVNLAELYFESLEGARNPSRFTPMNDDVRRLFRETAGYDPLENFSARTFLDFRAHLARRMQGEWMAELQRHRQSKAHLDLVLTHVDDRFDTGMKDSIGADAARALELLDEHDFTFLIEDPATVWHLGPKRYPEIAARYEGLTRHGSKLAIDINIAERYQDVYPTKQQTGTELFQLVHLAAGSFPRVALYFEKSLEAPDLPLLAAAAAAARRRDNVVESPRGIGIPWKGAARVD